MALDNRALQEWKKIQTAKAGKEQFLGDRSLISGVGFLRLRSEDQGKKIQDILRSAGIEFTDNTSTSSSSSSSSTSSSSSSVSLINSVHLIQGCSYKISALISSQGCYGDVYLALDQATQMPVAIKILRVPGDHEHLELEKIKKQGGHPNIVNYISSANVNGKTWIVMEYIKGMTRGRYEKASKWNQDLENQYQAAQKFLSECGVNTDRENEAENTLIVMQGSVPVLKLIDFGTLARK